MTDVIQSRPTGHARARELDVRVGLSVSMRATRSSRSGSILPNEARSTRAMLSVSSEYLVYLCI